MTPADRSPQPLVHLGEGARAVVADIVLPIDSADQQLVLRLMELGFVPGELVQVLRRSGGAGGPMAVRVGHSTFALRPHEATFILVRPEPS